MRVFFQKNSLRTRFDSITRRNSPAASLITVKAFSEHHSLTSPLCQQEEVLWHEKRLFNLLSHVQHFFLSPTEAGDHVPSTPWRLLIVAVIETIGEFVSLLKAFSLARSKLKSIAVRHSQESFKLARRVQFNFNFYDDSSISQFNIANRSSWWSLFAGGRAVKLILMSQVKGNRGL